jgi:endonuclease/exonuclease/phosphatase (EEP) superfamily protein YafD
MTFGLKTLTVASLLAGAGLSALGQLAPWWPLVDIVNNGLPLLLAGALVVLALAAATRDWRLIAAASALIAVNLWLAVSALQGAAQDAAPGSERALRVVTFNLWGGNDRIDDVAKFLRDSGADAMVLQEVTREHAAMLRQSLKPLYPFVSGEAGLVILSRHAFLAEGRIDRPGFPSWNSLMLRWVRLDVNGMTFELAGVHLARPFYPRLQQEDVAALTGFVLSRRLPLVVAGDFNMSPGTEKLTRFTNVTGIERYDTFHLTWPMRRGRIQLMPLAAIDNVFASRHFAKSAARIRSQTGDRRSRPCRAAGARRMNRIAGLHARSHAPHPGGSFMVMRLLGAVLAAMLWASPAHAEGSIEVWKSATCRCCINWVKHLEANGFAVKVNAADPSMLDRLKAQWGIGEKLAACHTAKIGPYVIEGHVPAPDIKRLVAEEPEAVGLTVPGMPIGSPGMEQGAESEPYDVLLIKKDGTTETFASH